MKYLSIDRACNNETLDTTHRTEFHYLEGIVADYGLAVGDLMGVIIAYRQQQWLMLFNVYLSHRQNWEEI